MSTRTVWGVGINDSTTPTQKEENGKVVWRCPYYLKWRKMMERAYSTKHHQSYPSYADVTVDPEWHYFSNFKEWAESQEEPITYHLDKDILFPGNRIYGPDKCLLVPRSVNSLFIGVISSESRGEYPVGVYYDRSRKKYRSILSCRNHTKVGKRFNTPQEAHDHWIQLKKEYIKEIQQEQTSYKIISALQYWYDNLEELVK